MVTGQREKFLGARKRIAILLILRLEGNRLPRGCNWSVADVMLSWPVILCRLDQQGRSAAVPTIPKETMTLAQVLQEMDLAFIAAGDHSITVAEAVKFVHHPHFVFLDVRTPEEHAHLAFPFARHIPLQQLPDRLAELPADKFFITFCFNGARAILAYAFLRTQGIDEVKALEGRVQELADALSPGHLKI